MAGLNAKHPPSSFGLASRPARYSLIFALVVGGAYGVHGGIVPGGPRGSVVYALLLVAVLLITARGPGRLPRPEALLLAIISLAASTLTLLLVDGPNELWTHSFGFHLIAMLVFRGRPALSLGASFAFFAIAVGWAAASGWTPMETVSALTFPVLAILASWLWALISGYFGRREMLAVAGLETARLRRLAEEETERKYRVELDRIAGIVGPALERIASGEALDDMTRREIAAVEGEVRDRIRAPGLHHPELARAVAAARRRGLRVLLLGGEADAASLSDPVAARIVELLEQVEAGSVTIRKVPPGRESAYSVLVESELGADRHSFDAAGKKIARSDVPG